MSVAHTMHSILYDDCLNENHSGKKSDVQIILPMSTIKRNNSQTSWYDDLILCIFTKMQAINNIEHKIDAHKAGKDVIISKIFFYVPQCTIIIINNKVEVITLSNVKLNGTNGKLHTKYFLYLELNEMVLKWKFSR